MLRLGLPSIGLRSPRFAAVAPAAAPSARAASNQSSSRFLRGRKVKTGSPRSGSGAQSLLPPIPAAESRPRSAADPKGNAFRFHSKYLNEMPIRDFAPAPF